MVARLYGLVLRALCLAERRCAYCKRFMGWKHGRAFRHYKTRPYVVTHGVCKRCAARSAADPNWIGDDVRRRWMDNNL